MSWRVNDSGWRSRARCGNQDPDKFFPKGRPSDESRNGCRSCPVRQECLEFALASPWEPAGIWGGLTAGEIHPLWLKRHGVYGRPAEVHELLGLA